MAANTRADEVQELIFIPGPGIGHIVAAVEAGKLIVTRDIHLSITYLLINDAEVRKHTHFNQHSHPRLRFLNLPELETPTSSNSPTAATDHVDKHKPLVREAVLAITETKTPVAGVIVDMFCVNMIDVADEFKLPTYTFFTSGAGFLSLMLFIQRLTDEEGLDITECDRDQEFEIPCFSNRFPAKALPSAMMEKNGTSEIVMHTARQIRRTRGVFINTFEELEKNAIQFLTDSKIPPIYPVGPLINIKNESDIDDGETIRWLDQQPTSSVVFLCFGSKGSFSEAQIKHLAGGLENSGHRFLWSFRGRNGTDFSILPEGFLQRTCGIGRVIGWAPQAAVLSHAAVGGFVSHCGWNSILEGLWHGVPMAAWPMYAEQQVNAFQMVVEMGLAVEIKMDYRDEMIGDASVVRAEVIERGIKRIMEDDVSGRREKVKDVREKSRSTLMEGGSSYGYLGSLIHDILQNSPSHSLRQLS
ncbi:hypothetical protein ACS0TY_030183 [Phlomoides rotata]